MATPDLVNGAFEALGSLFILNHCRVLWKSKQAHGVSILSTIFFAAWGVWNLFFYPHLDQWFSFIGGLAIMAANMVWISMLIYLRRSQRGTA